MLKAEDILYKQRTDKEYLPITVSISLQPYPLVDNHADFHQGAADFTKLASELAYGKESKPLAEGRVKTFLFYSALSDNVVQVAVSQSISGTGGLRIATGFLSMFYAGPKVVYLPDPTWGNHIAIVEQTGLKVVRYRWVFSHQGKRV